MAFFTSETLDFWRGLARNNSKAWFDEHRKDYEQHLKEPYQALAVALCDGLRAEQPEYTFSFYLLIVLHAAATVWFATFNGRYLRYEHELIKKEEQENRRLNQANGGSSYQQQPGYEQSSEGAPLLGQQPHPLV